MKKLLISSLILIMFSSYIQAQSSIKREKIKNLFVVMHQDSLLIKTFDNMSSALMQNVSEMFKDTMYTNHGIDPSKYYKKIMDNVMKKSKENALKLINTDMVDIYDKYFTIEDIDDFTAFYKTKSGQKYLSQVPDITKDLMEVMRVKYQKDLMQSLQKDIDEMTKEISEQVKEQKG